MHILGIDIGGTNIDLVFYDGDFRHLGTYPTSKYLPNFSKFTEKILDENKADGIGIGVAAWIQQGKLVLTPNLPKVPEISVDLPFFFENDANCFALYSSHFFRKNNMIGITVGTGVGSGIVINGRLYTGGGLAGEIGHFVVEKGGKECTCGGRGHLEAYFGGWSLRKTYGKEVKVLMQNEELVYDTVEYEYFCREIANIITLMDPEAVVFGGRIGMALKKERLKDDIYSYLMPQFQPEIEIMNDALAVAKGACLMALGKMGGQD